MDGKRGLTFFHQLLGWLSLFNPLLVALAVLVCAGGSYTVFVCFGRALASRGRFRWFWLAAICVSFGADVWTTHFIAMLAYMPALPFVYGFGRTACSILIAIFGSAIPFGYLILRPGRFGVIAGSGLGLVIGAMHFTGMSAMNTFGRGLYDPAFGLSGLAVGIVMSGAAIAAARRPGGRHSLVVASLCLVLAICGLHFIAMGGFSLAPPSAGAALADHASIATLIGTEWLALAVAGISCIILIATFATAVTDRRIGALQAHEADMLRYQARHDETTGLPNRLFLRECLAEAARAAEGRRGFAILSIDLDRFKLVNEIYGREAGDCLLLQAVARMRNLLEMADVVARIGGDKFVVLRRSEAHAQAAMALAERLIRALEEPFAVDGHSIAIAASVGVALSPPEAGTGEAVLLDAETALRHARMQGGGRAFLFEAEMRRQQEARRQLEYDFRLAIESRQFILHYQPLFDSDTLALIGFEALVRWQHPTRGLVSPADFIPFAERSGLINRLGLWVLETACAETARWPDPLRISINISPVQLRSGDLVGAVGAALEKSGLPARRLELEVTEGALIENPAQARSILSRLKDMGAQITIDDFGTGYSSLSYLRHFPFDRIKIDRSFLEHLEEDSDALLIVRAIINLGHSLRVGVLAEGVETPGQLQLLRKQNCDQLQGYLLGRPVPVTSATALVKTHARAGGLLLPAPKAPQDAALGASPALSG